MSECGLFWMGGGGWVNILGRRGWMGKYFGKKGMGGGELGWVHCLIRPNGNICFAAYTNLVNFYKDFVIVYE